VIRSILALLVFAAGSFAVPSSRAQDPDPEIGLGAREFGRLAIGFTGSFQYWSLTALEGTLNDRARHFSQDGFRFEDGAFELTYAFGIELQVRLSETWFARSQFEWSTIAWNDRDLTFIGQLGGRQRTPVSLSYESRVQTNPFFVTLGVGGARLHDAVRFAFSTSLVVAPLKLEDTFEVFIETGTKSEVTSKGTGFGLEADFTVDYFTDVRTNLFAELFFRLGSTVVELEETWWESSFLPGRRRVDFDGIGIRLGLRWF
jgi:hypothetical protein